MTIVQTNTSSPLRLSCFSTTLTCCPTDNLLKYFVSVLDLSLDSWHPDGGGQEQEQWLRV